jgi:hypothetical protein
MRHPFKSIHMILLIMGCSRHCKSVHNITITLVYCCLHALLVVRQFCLLTEETKDVVGSIYFISSVLTFTITQIILRIQTRKYRIFRKRIKKTLEVNDQQRFDKLSHFTIILCLLLTAIHITICFVNWKKVLKESFFLLFWEDWRCFLMEDILTPLLATTFIPLILHMGIPFSFIIYFYHMRVLMAFDSLILISCIKQLTKLRRTVVFDRQCRHQICLIQLQKLFNRRDDFESLFNLFPVIWFLWLFVNFHIIIQKLESYIVIDFTFNLFGSLIIVIITSYLTKKSDKLTKKIISIVQLERTQTRHRQCLYKLELMLTLERVSFSMTGWNMFNVDPRFVFSFLNSLVNITLVFLEVENAV